MTVHQLLSNPPTKTLGDELVTLRGVEKRYGRGPKQITALRGINLTIREGEFVALLGPSGCGKSTLLRIITGLNQASAGDVLYRGKPLHGVNPYTTIVFQAFALYPWLTVQENVEAALEPLGIAKLERIKRALRLLDRVGLDGFESAYPRELSGGMRQKVGFARAMAVEPELLCLDEPFSALDVLSAESLRGELMELWLSGSIPTKAILMVSHNIEEAVFMADRLIVMDKNPGHIIADLPNGLPHPRHRKDRQFLQLVDNVYGLIAGKTRTEAEELGTAPGEPGQTRALPDASINEIAGLLERITEEMSGRADLPQIGAEFNQPMAKMLAIVEAAEVLGFVTVEAGDVYLTPLGHAFAEASILARKELFANRIRRIPMIRWILSILQAADDRRVEWDVLEAALSSEFSKEDAVRQLDTALDWGRYAELFTYDQSSGSLVLELPAPMPAEGT
jgi:NitT/TauT family transport system ATP-binding protein